MNEASKASNRRRNLIDRRYEERWFRGRLLDVGCGPDPIRKEDWPLVTEIVPYDQVLGDSDATYLSSLPNESFDTVHSSHMLEHTPNPRGALVNWLRVLRPGGFIVCTVPEELYYEHGLWPSRFNPDHRVSFTLRALPAIPTSINVVHLLWKLPVDIEHVSLLSLGFDSTKLNVDQTMEGSCECAVEFVVRKPDAKNPW